ncbi:MAG: PEP-CTERM sorting domain-containing protein [Planctomycetota bacterium]
MVRLLLNAICLLLVISAAIAPGSVRAEWIYAISKSGNTLVRFDSANAVAVANLEQSTPVTTLVSGLMQPSGLALGPDGRLYIAEWGNGTAGGPPRISRYDIATNQWASLVTLNSSTQAQPSAIAFRPAGLGGQMLVGRVGILGSSGAGDIVQVSGWSTGSPTVSPTPYNTGITLNGSSGLAVAANGTTYVSNSQYVSLGGNPVFIGNVVSLNATGAYQQQVAADEYFSDGLWGPAGLILDGTSLFIGSVTNSKVFRTNLSTTSTTEFGSLGASMYYEVGPIAKLANGSILAASVFGSGVISILDSNGSLSSLGYYSSSFGQLGGIVIAPVPEPGSIGLVAAGLGGLAWVIRRQRRLRTP